jgi:HKD family nuclease
LAKHIKLIRPSAKVSWVHTNKFHAKIFILIKEGTPIFEIVGSSNMTKSAYGGCSNNRESDLMIYNEREFSDFQINKFVNNTISGQQNIITEFVYKDDSDINDGTSIADRMMSFLNLLKEEEQKAKKKKTY